MAVKFGRKENHTHKLICASVDAQAGCLSLGRVPATLHMDSSTATAVALLSSDELFLCNISFIETYWGQHGGVVVSTVPSQQEGSWFEPQQGFFCVRFACSPCACTPASSHSQFRTSIGGSKLPLGVIVHGCLSTCSPEMDWRSVQGVPLPFAWRELG